MKRFFFLAAFAATLTAAADDYTLYYDLASGEKGKEISAVANLQKIVFENDNIIVYKTDGTTQTVSIASASRLFFSTPETVGITAPEAEQAPQREGIYDLTGRKIDATTTDQLSRGVYIINGKKTLISK